ncbi:phycobilisome maturation protein [Leptolyngbya valderiana BDU 20041]|nr:HEAT repeat domain-containing protein [Geitlerinema sp. CS-897]OAB57477.1 phycobilisome maturation protein [Leptolyngbya valderiana BDU 20041]PPT09831.1 Phycocyanobilin lyase beta subunit [Geitlerinema sp. FC II]
MPVEALIAEIDRADSAASLLAAVRTLADARDPAAIPTLIRVLGFNNPGAAVAAVSGLVGIGKPAVVPLLEQLDSYNYGARAWAIRALSEIRDPRALEILVGAASDFALSVRRGAAKGLGSLHWTDLPECDRPISQQKVLDTLLPTTRDPEWVVRYAAIVGLETLGSNLTAELSDRLETIATCFESLEREDDELAVRARASLARGRVTRLLQ